MNNTLVTSTDGSTWTYAPVKYWPNESSDKLSFFAYAPYNEDYAVVGNGDPVLNFTVATDVTNQIDLLVADATNLKNLTKQTTTETVNFPFKHVLSRVGFKVEAVMDETNAGNGTADSDSQNNAIEAGTVISVQEVELIGDFNTAGQINLNTSAWSSFTHSETSYSLATADFEDVATNVTTTATLLNKASEYMMIIPTQTISIKIRVKYTVTTADNKLSGGSSVVENNITSEAFPFTFDKGKAYNFVLHLGLNSVSLSATVGNWDTVNGSDIVANVPINQ